MNLTTYRILCALNCLSFTTVLSVSTCFGEMQSSERSHSTGPQWLISTDYPIYRVSELVHALALDFRVHESMGIDWNDASSEDVGNYMGMLAAVDVIAETISLQNDRLLPSLSDYAAAFTAACLWPPNKPPLVRHDWQLLYPASYDLSTRTRLSAAVGEIAIHLPNEFTYLEQYDLTYATGTVYSGLAYVEGVLVLDPEQEIALPTEKTEYYEKVLDLRQLRDH